MAEVNDDEFGRIIRRMLGEQSEAQHRPTERPMVDQFAAASRQFTHLASRYQARAMSGDPEALRHMARAERELNLAAAHAVPEVMARWPWHGRPRPTALYM